MASRRRRAKRRQPAQAASQLAIAQPVPVAQRVGSSRAGLRFLVTAVALMALLYGAYYFPYSPGSLPARALDGVLAAQGSCAAWLIGVFEQGVSASDGVIHGRFPMRVVKACSSLDAQALFAATVLAFPAGLRAKLFGLGFGICALTGLNIARIASLYFVGLHAPGSFDAIHEEVLPLALVCAACGAFAAWAAWARRLQPGPTQR